LVRLGLDQRLTLNTIERFLSHPRRGPDRSSEQPGSAERESRVISSVWRKYRHAASCLGRPDLACPRIHSVRV